MDPVAEAFPAVDPIPLPAPIWLFKLLHQVTLALHFAAVELLLGGLFVALAWAILARTTGDASFGQGAGLLTQRVPTVMAYVVNLGIPPLLFTQVLYGRALYTSSVLIGAYWIGVIFLVTASYYGLYVSARRAREKKGWAAVWTASLALALAVGFIYSNNMTLMLRPEAWNELYAADPAGRHLNAGDPTVWPRWLFMVVGSLPITGLGLVLFSTKATHGAELGRFLRRWGGGLAAVGVVVQGLLGGWVMNVQPDGVAGELMASGFYGAFAWGWIATAVAVLALGAAAFARAANGSRLFGWVAAAVAFLNLASVVVVRDGIRDLTLLRAGFDVWDRVVVTNWSVVGLFLVLFVAGVATILWMATVVARAESVEERYV